MAILRSADYRAVLDLVHTIDQAADADDFVIRLLPALARLVPCEATGLHVSGVAEDGSPWNRGAVFPDLPIGGEEVAIFDRYTHQHPLLSHYFAVPDSRAYRFSDFLRRRDFHRLELYNEFYRPLRIDHQLVTSLRYQRSSVVACALNRERRDFTDRERMLLDLARPHLVRAYENAELRDASATLVDALNRGLDVCARAILLVTDDRRIAGASRRAERWLQEYFADSRAGPGRLPRALDDWIRRQEGVPDLTDGTPSPPLAARRDDRRLVVRLLPRREGDALRILLLEQREERIPVDDLEPLGLTRREAEVLSWVALGKTNGEIAEILGTSPRTVAKHLEHVFEKLGVGSRTAAVAQVRSFRVIPGNG